MYPLPHPYECQRMAQIQPALAYEQAEAFPDWQQKAKQKLTELLRLPLAACDDSLTIEFEKEFSTFHEIRFRFQSEPGFYVPCHLWLPKGCLNPPVAICLQGHSTGMHISMGRPKFPGDEETMSGGDRDFAVRALAEGFATLCIEQRGFGESGGTPEGPDCYQAAMASLLIGRTLLGQRVWDVQRAIDVLERHFPQVDTKTLLCMGNSSGGTTTFYAACLDSRIQYAVVSSAFCTYEASIASIYHCSCNFVPDLRLFFDMSDLSGLIAPRPLILVSGVSDDIFPQDGVQEAYKRAQSLYAAADASEALQLIVCDGGHRFYADAAWPVIRSYLPNRA